MFNRPVLLSGTPPETEKQARMNGSECSQPEKQKSGFDLGRNTTLFSTYHTITACGIPGGDISYGMNIFCGISPAA
jgi:hypothetical protein